MSRNILILRFDPDAEEGLRSFPLCDVREALKAIGDPIFKEWGIEEEDGGIETGEQITCTMPDGRPHFATATDTFLFSVKDGQVTMLDWERPLGREGTLRALWRLMEIHHLSLIDTSGGQRYPMFYVLSEAFIMAVERVCPDCRETGIHVFSGYEDFRSYFKGW